jgi:hypothetical protein
MDEVSLMSNSEKKGFSAGVLHLSSEEKSLD